MIENTPFWLFPTIISKFNLNSEIKDFNKIVSVIQGEQPSSNLLIKNGTRSMRSNFLKKIPELKVTIQNCVDIYSNYLGLERCDISYSWCNVYSKNGEIKRHRHELSMISGVFYVKADLQSGDLVFDNPLNMFRVNEISVYKTDYNTHDYKFNVSTGDLILFPSWIMHYTENNFSDERYVISFDTRIKNYGMVD